MLKRENVTGVFRDFESKWVGAAEDQTDAVLRSFSF